MLDVINCILFIQLRYDGVLDDREEIGMDWEWHGILCANCAVVAANDDWTGVDEKDPKPLGLVPDDLYVIVSCCDPQDCEFDHKHSPHLEDAVDCDGCGTTESARCPAVAGRYGL